MKANLKDHAESIHDAKKSHKCLSCDHSFSRIDSLKHHIECVHENKRPYQGGLRTVFDWNDAQRLFSKLSSLVAFDSFLKIPPGALFLWCALSKKE